MTQEQLQGRQHLFYQDAWKRRHRRSLIFNLIALFKRARQLAR